uniref:G2/mitotic-specific cyclin-B3 n=2 Tax=Caenorhabditis japonica TaxID=281687 RepID=A0A8R1HJ55_CAEJA
MPTQGNGKLTRQMGTSNLRMMAPKERTNNEPIIKTDVKENFEVLEDPEPVVEERKCDNNFIHELERKMEEKSREDEQKRREIEEENNKFLLPRATSEVMSICSEPQSEFSTVSAAYDDDDCDKISVASSTFTTVRASFSSFHFDRNHKEEKEAKRTASIKKKADKEERDNAMFTSEEYFHDIYKYMTDREMRHRASSKHMAKQVEINDDMRAILIDWFHDVIKEYNLQKETFHLAVSLVDRVMTFLHVDKVQFQLVGTTALMIASKYEEIFPPEIDEFAIITDNTYRVSDILRMERYLLGQLKFVVSSPTTAWFGECFSKRMVFSQRMHKSLDYLVDLSLLEIDFLNYRPSHIAAASCCFANLQADMEAWPKKMQEDTGIKTDDFVHILEELHRLYISASTSDNKSIYTKYCEIEEREVALIPAPTKKLVELFPATFGPRRQLTEL